MRVIGVEDGILPAQNATGNWIKIVQRLPVRIALNPEELQKHPLRIGFSMHAKVNLREGQDTSNSTFSPPHYQTKVFTEYGKQADEEIRRIIADNLKVKGAGV